uniref:SAP domain-containing protein n=1 Tax=Candidozyma auris TaxID=498019 RepID=A0A0L0NUD3_CANAR
MTDYASLTVAQLKEQLKAKGLALDGKKADLVQRLVDLDAGEAQTEPAKEEPKEEPTKEEAPKQTEEKKEAPADENGAKTEEKVEDKKPKELSPEERKQLAVDLITKKIKRAEKFGDEQLAQAARKDLARVEKFGVDPGTALAREIGLVDKQVNSGLGNFRRRKGKGHRNKSKGKKGKVGK